MQRNLALFDLDHTLLPLDSDQAWAHYLTGLGLADGARHADEIDRHYRAYAAGELDMHAYLDVTLAPLARYPRAQLEAWRAQFMRDVIAPAIRPEALALVARHRDAGDLCCIVTATNTFVTAPIAAALGVDHLLAIELGTRDGTPGGEYTGKSVGVLSFREGKIERTDAWLAALGRTLGDFERSWFYSDSINDAPLLERVTDPVATNPDARLAAIAAARGWPVLRLFDEAGVAA
ncbi:HAD family hydrolase [Burkholderia guangdongensis]|uniref:histidinol-phosphatase n=1 Tax=Burkholderia guangdongensis TaxID=1792500 RepID=UPI0015C755C7|nr:HAD family hydrolase [Burkholderia guangdongensis]